MTLDRRIALAIAHVENGRRIIERQRKIVADGLTGKGGRDLLETFERSQAIFETDLAELLKAARK